jgi:hypothetical protein
MSTHLNTEQTLLLNLCRIERTEEVTQQVRIALTRGVDWVTFLRLAIPHGVLPLVHLNLSGFAELVPQETMTQLEKAVA